MFKYFNLLFLFQCLTKHQSILSVAVDGYKLHNPVNCCNSEETFFLPTAQFF